MVVIYISLLLKQCSLLRRSLSYSRLYPQFKYMTFIYSHSFIHHFTGLFGTKIMTSSQLQLACQLRWQSTAPVSQKPWVQIPYRPEFFSGLIFTTAQVVFIIAKIAFIFTFFVLLKHRQKLEVEIRQICIMFSYKKVYQLSAGQKARGLRIHYGDMALVTKLQIVLLWR